MILSSRWIAGPLAALVGVFAFLYLTVATSSADGRPVAPLDDAYITYQYARQIARGHPYQYNDGDPPTTGMTSPLFGFLLAGAYRLGCTGQRLVALALWIGVIWLGLTGWLSYRLAWRVLGEGRSGQGWAMVAAIAVLLTGAAQWACFNGMETGLFTALTLAALEALLARRMGLCALWLALAGLTRPEGLILAAVVWLASVVSQLLTSRSLATRPVALLSAALAATFVPLMLNWALTGTTLSTGVQAKSWLLNVPNYARQVAGSILFSWRQIVLGLFFGWDSPVSGFVPPGLLALSVVGWAALGVRRQWKALAVTGLWFLAGTLSTATLITATWHLGRYQVPFAPVLIVSAVSGLAFLQALARRRWQSALLGLAVLFLAGASAYRVPDFLHLYRGAASTMVRQQLVVADWLRDNVPAGARVGVHDTGSLRYLADRPTYDLIGLTTADAAIPWRHGAGSVFELMERSPMRPDYFAIYPDAFSIPYLAATDLFAEQLLRVEVPDAVIASASSTQGVWRADWHLVDSGDRLYQPDVLARTAGLKPVDRLDLADLRSEGAHGLEWWQDVLRTGFPTEVWQLTYRASPGDEVLDGGRLLTGGMEFDVSTEPGQQLWIVARLHAQEAGAVRVEVDGHDVGRWAYPPVPGEWLETVFRVPAEAVARSRTRVTLRVDADNPDFRHYAPYYFWFLQGEADVTPVEMGYPVHVTFDGRLRLLGFDLPRRSWNAGDVVPVTLYWQTSAWTSSDAQVFAHLYDASGSLGPQSDGWAFHGTRPPYAWWPGEVVADPRLLALPADLASGPYTLEVGLYRPDGSGRLAAFQDGIRQDEERVTLATIQVTE